MNFIGKVFPLQARRVGRGIALLFHDRGTRRGWVVSSTARPHLPPGKRRYPFQRRLGGPQGRSVRAENLVLTATRSRTVQPVAQSLYRLSFPVMNFTDIKMHGTTIKKGIYLLVQRSRPFSFNWSIWVGTPSSCFQPYCCSWNHGCQWQGHSEIIWTLLICSSSVIFRLKTQQLLAQRICLLGR